MCLYVSIPLWYIYLGIKKEGFIAYSYCLALTLDRKISGWASEFYIIQSISSIVWNFKLLYNSKSINSSNISLTIIWLIAYLTFFILVSTLISNFHVVIIPSVAFLPYSYISDMNSACMRKKSFSVTMVLLSLNYSWFFEYLKRYSFCLWP